MSHENVILIMSNKNANHIKPNKRKKDIIISSFYFIECGEVNIPSGYSKLTFTLILRVKVWYISLGYQHVKNVIFWKSYFCLG